MAETKGDRLVARRPLAAIVEHHLEHQLLAAYSRLLTEIAQEVLDGRRSSSIFSEPWG